jgi:RNA polymerase sigma-70 factor, ECF subfamily
LAAVSPVGRASGLEPLSPHGVEALYQQHARSVFAYCLSKLRRREDAEDAVQTTFLHAVHGLQRGVVPNIELAWLLGIARNVCLSRRESAGRRGRLELVCDPVDLDRAPARAGCGDDLIGLRDALARLPERQRQAVLLRDWRGLSYGEIAEQLGVSLANAESLIFRGRNALAEMLDERPAATRRRLAALGNLGSAAAWLKSALTGASTAVKIIAAATTVAAVSATGVAVGTSAPERPPQVPSATAHPPAGASPASRDTVAPMQAVGSGAAVTPAPARRAATAPPAAASSAAPDEVPAAAPAATPSVAETPTVPLKAPPLPTPVAALPPPVQVPPALEPVGKAVSAVVEAVKPVVDTTTQMTEALPAVTVTPPPLVPLQPVTVAPGALLP